MGLGGGGAWLQTVSRSFSRVSVNLQCGRRSEWPDSESGDAGWGSSRGGRVASEPLLLYLWNRIRRPPRLAPRLSKATLTSVRFGPQPSPDTCHSSPPPTPPRRPPGLQLRITPSSLPFAFFRSAYPRSGVISTSYGPWPASGLLPGFENTVLLDQGHAVYSHEPRGCSLLWWLTRGLATDTVWPAKP